MFYFDILYNPIMPIMAQYNMFNFGFAMPQFYPNQNIFFNPFESVFNSTCQQGQHEYSNVSVFTNQQRQHNTYNKAKADLLLKNAKAGLPETDPVPPLCARYVKNAIVKSGLGEYINGNGEEAKYMLRNNLNFKEVKVHSAKDLERLPKGAVIVYDGNTPVEYKDGKKDTISQDGHVGFKTKRNEIISDRIEEMPLTNRAYAFIPV